MRDSFVVTAKLKMHSGISVNGMHGIHRFTTYAEEPVQVLTQCEE